MVARGDPARRPPRRDLGASEGQHRVGGAPGNHRRARSGRGDRRRRGPGGKAWKGERIFKIVSFYLLRYRRGRLGDLPAKFRHEVDEVRWLPLEDAPRLLSYKGEREMAEKALALLNGEVV